MRAFAWGYSLILSGAPPIFMASEKVTGRCGLRSDGDSFMGGPVSRGKTLPLVPWGYWHDQRYCPRARARVLVRSIHQPPAVDPTRCLLARQLDPQVWNMGSRRARPPDRAPNTPNKR